VTLLESDLPDERLLLAVRNGADNGILCKTSIPLAPVVPGFFYSLRLVTPEGTTLYLTLFLHKAPSVELGYRCAVGRVRPEAVARVKLSGCSAPVRQLAGPLAASKRLQLDSEGCIVPNEVWGVWRYELGAASESLRPQVVLMAHAVADAHDEGSISDALRALSDAAVQGSGPYLQAVPFLVCHGDGTERLLWPPEVMVQLPYGFQASEVSSDLSLELHERAYLPPAAQFGADGVASFMARVRLSQGLLREAVVKDADSPLCGPLGIPLRGPLKVPLGWSMRGPSREPDDLVSEEQPWVDEVGRVLPRERGQPTTLEGLPLLGDGNVGLGVTAIMEAQVWGWAAYVERLKAQAGPSVAGEAPRAGVLVGCCGGMVGLP